MLRISLAVATLLLVSLLCKGQALENKYLKWLNEEVVYILEPSEKKIFLALKTDSERDEFIKAFWQRRDPDPDTPENEWRDEYYERIAYANEHFGFGNALGWRADRGRTYIILGKPHAVEKTSTGEIWTYNYIVRPGPTAGPGQKFEFVRMPGSQDLRLKGGN
jgi:GWxTD domain-containing protein